MYNYSTVLSVLIMQNRPESYFALGNIATTTIFCCKNNVIGI